MLPRGAAKNEAPRRPRYFSARASRAARRRFEDAPRTFGQDWFVIPQGLRTPVRPHGTRQQPRLSCVPIVFDYILIQGCKSKKIMPRRTIKTTANSRRGAKRAKTSPRDENRANAAKTKKSVSRRACPLAQTRRRPRKIHETAQSRPAPRKTYEAPHTQRRGRQTPPRRPS